MNLIYIEKIVEYYSAIHKIKIKPENINIIISYIDNGDGRGYVMTSKVGVLNLEQNKYLTLWDILGTPEQAIKYVLDCLEKEYQQKVLN